MHFCISFSVCLMLSYISVKQAVVEANIILPLVHLLQHAEFDIKKEAAWAISNATSGGSHDQIRYVQLSYSVYSFSYLHTCTVYVFFCGFSLELLLIYYQLVFTFCLTRNFIQVDLVACQHKISITLASLPKTFTLPSRIMDHIFFFTDTVLLIMNIIICYQLLKDSGRLGDVIHANFSVHNYGLKI